MFVDNLVMKIKLLIYCGLVLMLGCDHAVDRAHEENAAAEMLHAYHQAMERDGLMAEFDYLDSSEFFFWVPPGFSERLEFNDIRPIIAQNAQIYTDVLLQWDQLKVQLIQPGLASFSGISSGSWKDTNGVITELAFIESGTLIKRGLDWKILTGQTSVLPQENTTTAPIIHAKAIEKSRVVNCPVNEVWFKWTTHEGLLTFFGKDNKVDLRPGGPYEIYFLMDNPPGTKGGEGNTILSFVPEQMLSFTWNAPPKYPEVRNHEHRTWVVVTFTEVADGKTKVTLRHLGWLAGEQWDQTFQYFDSAWDTVLGWLDESCNQ